MGDGVFGEKGDDVRHTIPRFGYLISPWKSDRHVDARAWRSIISAYLEALIASFRLFNDCAPQVLRLKKTIPPRGMVSELKTCTPATCSAWGCQIVALYQSELA
jgi:hypothetical protein